MESRVAEVGAHVVAAERERLCMDLRELLPHAVHAVVALSVGLV